MLVLEGRVDYRRQCFSIRFLRKASACEFDQRQYLAGTASHKPNMPADLPAEGRKSTPRE